MIANSLPSSQVHQNIINSNSQELNAQIAQESIYSFWLGIVNTYPPEDVLREFKRLFIDCLDSGSLDTLPVIHGICFANNEQEFRNTIKRCYYIIVNNWASNRKHKYIQELVNLFAHRQSFRETTTSTKTNVYKSWVENFVNSNDYKELKLSACRYEDKDKSSWANRYTTYLLVAQSCDANNPKEQQEAAKKLSRQMKDKFKFELAMYIARSQSTTSNVTRYRNPSILGDNVLHLIKKIVLKKGEFSYENIANIFISQTQNQTLKDFKKSIQKYLFFSVGKGEVVETLKQQLTDKLSSWKSEQNEETVDKNLLLRSCNRLIDCLTTENGREPSPLFILLLSHGHPLTLVIILLKIILICKNARSHLETRVADLIGYYEHYPEDECKWVINFIEIFNITFAIYAENVDYNLINMKEEEANRNLQLNLDAYHVFSQSKSDKQIWQ
jgi:hypothetical protein